MVTGAPVPAIVQTQEKMSQTLPIFLAKLRNCETAAHAFSNSKEPDSGCAVESCSILFFIIIIYYYYFFIIHTLYI